MALTPEDIRSETWKRLAEHCRQRIQRLRELNDSGDLETTTRRRGQIAELKSLLALDPNGPEAQRSGRARLPGAHDDDTP